MSEDKKPLWEVAYQALDDKKGIDIVVIEVTDVSVIADHLVLVTANSSVHLQTLAQNVMDEAEMNGYKVYGSEGLRDGKWALIDLGYVIVHVMSESIRNFYSLEKLWSNGKIVTEIPASVHQMDQSTKA